MRRRGLGRGGLFLATTAAVSSLLLALTGCREPPPKEPARAARLIDYLPSSLDVTSGERIDAFRHEGRVGAYVRLNGELRPALVPSESSRLSFVVEIPSKAQLRFAIAAIAREADAFEAEFQLTVRGSGEPAVVFREVVGRQEERRWLDRTVDLTPWANTTSELLLETKRLGGGDAVTTVWGDPVIAGRVTPERPTLILVSIDCLRADHMGVYGYARPTTPNLDRFARESVVFEDAVASASWTVPSHYTMFTGLPPSFHGVAAYPNAIWGGTAALLPPGVSYLPEMLARAGYQAHAVVTSAPVSSTYGFHRGFSTFRELAPDAAGAVDAALRVLSRSADREQFLFLHLIDPHAPYLPKVAFQPYSKRYLERFGPRPADISGLLTMVGEGQPPGSENDVRAVEQLYDAAVAYVDEQLGRFFAELDHSGILDRSVVIVTADHGEAFYDHGVWQHGKNLYQSVLHIPLLVRWPKEKPLRSPARVSLADVAPTLLAAAGMDATAAEGQDLARLVAGEPRESPLAAGSEMNLATTDGIQTLVSFEKDGKKYIATLAGSFDDTGTDRIVSEDLYDLVADPDETESLAGEDEAAVREFREMLKAYLGKGRNLRARWGDGANAIPDEETLKALEALGYVR